MFGELRIADDRALVTNGIKGFEDAPLESPLRGKVLRRIGKPLTRAAGPEGALCSVKAVGEEEAGHASGAARATKPGTGSRSAAACLEGKLLPLQRHAAIRNRLS